jgi:hypothetical protein
MRCALPNLPQALFFAGLHGIGPTQKPVDRNVEPVRDLGQPVDVQRTQSRMLQIDGARWAAEPDADAKLLVSHAANAAGNGEPLPEYEEICFHPSNMRKPRRRRKAATPERRYQAAFRPRLAPAFAAFAAGAAKAGAPLTPLRCPSPMLLAKFDRAAA